MTIPEWDMYTDGRNPVWEKSWAGGTSSIRIDDCGSIYLLTCLPWVSRKGMFLLLPETVPESVFTQPQSRQHTAAEQTKKLANVYQGGE